MTFDPLDKEAHLLPPNRTGLEKALDGATARIGKVPVPIDDLADPAKAPTAALPYLAWALSVDRWDANWPDTVKRRVITASLAVHRRKGTLGAVKDALAAMGIRAEVIEWWQESPKGAPHTFSISALANDNQAIAITSDLARAIDAVKPVRSHFRMQIGAEMMSDLSFSIHVPISHRLQADLTAPGGLRQPMTIGAILQAHPRLKANMETN
ncbi:MAG: phage tail protein I [Pseudomonadota bacterium]